MSVDEILFDAESRMEKAIEVLKHALGGIRTGRANPGLVDSVRVEAYGSTMPIKQLATISCPEPTQIVIKPFDQSTIKDIEKGIQASSIGFTPLSDGRIIRLNVPPLSTEVRRKMVTRLKEVTEEAKVAIRNIRRDSNKDADQAEKAKTITEDDRDGVKEDIQSLTKQYEAQATNLAEAKEAEVMND
ncbi:MAG: ribosome recycling factor [Pirellulales bacterium]